MELLGHRCLQCIVCLKFCKNVLIIWKCVLILFPFLRLPSTDKNLQMPNSWLYSPQLDFDDSERIRAKFRTLFDGYRKMFDRSLSKSKDLGDMLRLLPGVVVQREMSIQGMADLFRTKRDSLECLIKSAIEPLRPSGSPSYSRSSGSPAPYPLYKLNGYLSCFLQDRDRSQLYYSDPKLQHLSICRHFMSLLDGSNSFDLQS